MKSVFDVILLPPRQVAVRTAALAALGILLLAGSPNSRGETATVALSQCEEGTALASGHLGALILGVTTRQVVDNTFGPIRMRAGMRVVPVLVYGNDDPRVLEEGYSLVSNGVITVDGRGTVGTNRPLSDWRFLDPDSLVQLGTVAVVYRGVHGRATVCLRFV